MLSKMGKEIKKETQREAGGEKGQRELKVKVEVYARETTEVRKESRKRRC